MKLYKDNDNIIWAYELDGSQDHLIGDKTPMYILFYLIHHNSYHLGQAELAIKKGKSY